MLEDIIHKYIWPGITTKGSLLSGLAPRCGPLTTCRLLGNKDLEISFNQPTLGAVNDPIQHFPALEDVREVVKVNPAAVLGTAILLVIIRPNLVAARDLRLREHAVSQKAGLFLALLAPLLRDTGAK